eukprot:1475238-Ditylum_brightwellii.AAC.1
MFCNEAAASLGQGVILGTIPEDTMLRKTKCSREYDGRSIADRNDDNMSTASNYSRTFLLPTIRVPHMQMQQALQNQVFAQQQAFNLTQTALQQQQQQQGDLNQKLSA